MYGVELEGLGVSKKAKDTPSPARSHQEVGRNIEEKKGGNTVRACNVPGPVFASVFTTSCSVK